MAEAIDGELRWLCGGYTREEAVDEVLRRADAGGVAGFDFSFSFPRWYVESLGAGDGPGVWDVAATDGERWLAECAPPFWGRPGRPRPPLDNDRSEWRRTERGPLRPKSTFQVGGVGSVGTGSVRGMPLLRRLRAGGVAIWPFDPPAPGRPVVAEVYPRWATGPVAKRRASARAAHIVGLARAIPPGWAELATASEDAFDAACAALVLSTGGWTWPATDDVDRTEGRIVPVGVGAAQT